MTDRINIGNIDQKERYLRHAIVALIADFRRAASRTGAGTVLTKPTGHASGAWEQAATELQQLLDDYVKACWPAPTVAPEAEDTAICERCGGRPAELIDLHGHTAWLCEGHARTEAPYLFSDRKEDY